MSSNQYCCQATSCHGNSDTPRILPYFYGNSCMNREGSKATQIRHYVITVSHFSTSEKTPRCKCCHFSYEHSLVEGCLLSSGGSSIYHYHPGGHFWCHSPCEIPLEVPRCLVSMSCLKINDGGLGLLLKYSRTSV